MDILSLHDVTKRFGDFVAVDNLSFSVADGQVVGFLGANHKEPYWVAPGMLCVAAHLRSTNCRSVSRASVKYCTGNSG